MSSQEALRDLPVRQAEAGQPASPGRSWLAVESAGRSFLFPLSEAGEIFPMTPLMPVPHAQAWFLGVANLRGGLYGVVDLASFVGGGAPAARPDHIRAESRLVALNTALEVNCALLIDRLAGLRNLDAFTASARAPEGSPAFFGSGYTDAGGAYWQEINLQALSQQPQFLSISA